MGAQPRIPGCIRDRQEQIATRGQWLGATRGQWLEATRGQWLEAASGATKQRCCHCASQLRGSNSSRPHGRMHSVVRRVLAYYQSGPTVVNSREYDSDVLPFRTAGIAAKTPAGAILFNGWDLSVLAWSLRARTVGLQLTGGRQATQRGDTRP
jgi:hypothetical protein